MQASGRFLFPEGKVLFSFDGATYEMVQDLGTGPHGERILSALRRVKGKAAMPVILKALPRTPGKEGLKEARKRLREEVKLASFLRHPNIARVHGAHEAKGTLYLITEAVPGCSLNTLLEIAFTRERHFPEPFMLYVGAQIAQALAHAHTCQSPKGTPLKIVHRAIDSSHIRMTLDGQVKLTDFGVASARLPGQRSTRRPGVRGEVFWASPEVLLGHPEDARSDLFTLGMVLLEFATGRHLLTPYTLLAKQMWELIPEAEEQQVQSAILRAKSWGWEDAEETILRAATFTPGDVEEATQPLSEPTRALFRRLLRRNPADRYTSACILQDELMKALRTHGRYTTRMAAREIQAALHGVGRALAEEEEGTRLLSAADYIETRSGTA